MRGASLCDGSVVVRRGPIGERIGYFNDSFLGEKNGTRLQGRVLIAIFLEVAQAENAAGQNRPQLSLRKLPLLKISLVNLIVQSPLRVLKQRIYFVESGAILVFTAEKVVLEGYYMFVASQLDFELCQFVHGLIGFLLVIEVELAEQELFLRFVMTEEGQIIWGITMDDFIIFHEVRCGIL